ncbi:MAG TPA: hypothetical protein VGR56_04340 [Nitrososphaerales archaeon]|nr:hypothetical protein [Nitrososphaerales archaeon]
MERFEDLVSKLLSSLPASANADPVLDRLAALAAIADTKRFKRKELKDVKRVFHAELSQYIASGKRPLVVVKRTDEIRRHRMQIRDLSLLAMLPWTGTPGNSSLRPSRTRTLPWPSRTTPTSTARSETQGDGHGFDTFAARTRSFRYHL